MASDCLDSLCCFSNLNRPQPINEKHSTSLLEGIKKCHTLSKQTHDLCTSTLSTSKDLVSCGESIQQSLTAATTEIRAKSFAFIADLIDGDKVKQARKLAESMKDKSSQCTSLSVEMVTTLERTVDALPDAIEKYVEGKASETAECEMTNEERDLADVDKDVKDLTDCIDAIKILRLVTAVSIVVHSKLTLFLFCKSTEEMEIGTANRTIEALSRARVDPREVFHPLCHDVGG